MHKKEAQGQLNSGSHIEMEGSRPAPYWLSMMKLAAADWSMAAADVACLLERNLVARTGHRLGVEADDRVVLGLTV
jgi:hypothetical protein